MLAAIEELKRVKAEAAAARQVAEQSQTKLVESRRDNRLRLRLTALVMMTAALMKLAWQAGHAPQPTPGTVQPLARLASSIPARFDGQGGGSSGSLVIGQFPRALNRLSAAFHSFPDEDQMEIVHEVNRKYPGSSMTCPLVWKNGVPALYVGEKTGEPPPSLIHAVEQCAKEIEKLRVEKVGRASLR
jgi:hypothetical protein